METIIPSGERGWFVINAIGFHIIIINFNAVLFVGDIS